jgi:hypothetical protein
MDETLNQYRTVKNRGLRLIKLVVLSKSAVICFLATNWSRLGYRKIK